ncbi:MAG: di/tricarboxylate transporter [Flavobacteriales bacterium]|jgi:di/tricarboxylate transporter
MDSQALITLIIVLIGLVLFLTEWVTVDVVALFIIAALSISGVLPAEEALNGFSNGATLTVLFMFVLSAAMLKTGALQYVASNLSKLFQRNFKLGLFVMMAFVAVISAFINNTPIVAVFIPVVFQISSLSGHSPSKILIPLSFASILGGMTTLLGSSTNMLVNGIVLDHGLPGLNMFTIFPIGILLLVIGLIYMAVIGTSLLPNRDIEKNLSNQFDTKKYVAEIELLQNNKSIGKRILDSELVRNFKMDIIEVRRGEDAYFLPAGDFILLEGDSLKVRCNVNKIKELKDREKVSVRQSVKLAGDDLKGTHSTLIEMIVRSNSEFKGKTLKELDFRRTYRAIPLAIQHREEVMNDNIYETVIQPGDTILAEVRNHFVKDIKQISSAPNAPFVVLSEQSFTDFNLNRFLIALMVLIGVVLSVSSGWLPMSISALTGVLVLVVAGSIDMKEAYESVRWKVIFLLAGSLSIGAAMHHSGLDILLADKLLNTLGGTGPIFVLSAVYILTSCLTEIMSNSAAAALMTPISLTIAASLGVDYMPFVICISLAASASFMTPIGYQTNTMVYDAGGYKFKDFLKVGTALNIIFWLAATFLIPYFYPF